MTKLSKKEQTHQRIVSTAAAMIRKDGFEKLAVADVMKQAGLTHGGFYAHFANRETLVAEALAYAKCSSQQVMNEALITHFALATPAQHSDKQQPLAVFIELYLSEQHLSGVAVGEGCPVAALACEFHRLETQSKAVATEAVTALISKLATLGHMTLAQAFLLTSALVGALQLARSFPLAEGLSYLQSSKQQLQLMFVKTAEPA